MTAQRHKPLLERDFLKAELAYEFSDYQVSGEDARLFQRLQAWTNRGLKRETQTEASFVQRFFIETWGFRDDGTGAERFQLYPKFPIAGAGQTGNRGEADLAIGSFVTGGSHIPQVVCEFKDIKSALDAPQNRKGNNRSPVMQARDYLYQPAMRLTHAGDSQIAKSLNLWVPTMEGRDHGFGDRFAGGL